MTHELIASSDFKSAQAEFMKQNYPIFDNDDDENKLEYTSVFESYVQIMEQLIEHKLKEKFSEQEVNEFTMDFKNNYKAYEQYDQETV
jgi:ADP-ribosylation factor 2-binding protein